MEGVILTGWFHPFDVLVFNNAAIHEKGYNYDLREFLWEPLGLDGSPLQILLLPLPTRLPELNPIELLWNTLVMRLKTAFQTRGT